MKRKHYILKDEVFEKCKYLKTFERKLGINDLKKNDEMQYRFMLDTLDYFVKIYNALNVDANYGISDRIEKMIDVMTQYLFDIDVYDVENDSESKKRYRYSVRYVNNNIIDELTRQIYMKTIVWYRELNKPIKARERIELPEYKEMVFYINHIMSRLERVGFDKVYDVNISYNKNKNDNYKIYINRLGSLSDEKTKFQIEYMKEFNDNNKVKINKQMVDECVTYLFDLVSYGINGLSVKLYGNSQVIYNYKTSDKCPLDYYLELTGIEISREIYFRNQFEFDSLFNKLYHHYDLSNKKALIEKYGCFNEEEFLSSELFNSNPQEAFKRRDYLLDNYDYSKLTEYLQDYDLYRFRYCVDYLSNLSNSNFSYKLEDDIFIKSLNVLGTIKDLKNNSILEKIVDDLVVAQNFINEEKFLDAYKVLTNVVNRYNKFFKRVS